MGSTASLIDVSKYELEALSCREKLTISLDSKLHGIWGPIIMIALFYSAFFVPFRLAFIQEEPPLNLIIDHILDSIFIIDLILNFFMSYEDAESGREIKDPKRITRNYLKTWFVLDLLACVPFDLVFSLTLNQDRENLEEVTKLARVARIYRLYRLIRLLRIFKVLRLVDGISQ
jgi:hypothetical protein